MNRTSTSVASSVADASEQHAERAGRSIISSVARSSWLLSVIIFVVFVAVWHLLTTSSGGGQTAADSEYAKLMGQSVAAPSTIPSPGAVVKRAGELAKTAFDTSNPNNIGIVMHLVYSLGRVLLGYAIAVAVAVPLGFAIGLVPRLYKALNPFIQILKPVSPLAWMPLALYSLKDSGASAIFIIFICSLWPMLINTAVGAASVRQDWVNVSRVLGLPWYTQIIRIVFPASVPMILTGMRISVGIAWFVIVAAEMVVGQNGIGYFIWNEWNNLQISSMIVAIVLIGFVGLALDQALAKIALLLSFRE